MCNNLRKVKVESKVTGVSYYIDAPCGLCCECIKNRQNDWKLRLCEEARNWLYAYFFTLTYSPDFLPYNVNHTTGECFSTARKTDIQSWLKLMRERYQRCHDGVRLKMKYFICAEYGPRGTKRPHYHGLIFSDAPSIDMAPLFKWWADNKGYVSWKLLTPTSSCPDIREHRSKTANYVSKYCCKGEFASRRCQIKMGLIERAWTVCSKNIGVSYVDRMREFHLPSSFRIASISGSFVESDVMPALQRCDFDDVMTKELDIILSRSKVCDGNYFYKMPRYYRDRIYGIRSENYRIVGSSDTVYPVICPCFSGRSVYKEKHYVFYETPSPVVFSGVKKLKTVRYGRENFLSVAMRCRLQQQHDIEYCRKFDTIKEHDSTMSDAEIIRFLEACKRSASLAREEDVKERLSNFYVTNMFRNGKLNGLFD